MIRLSLPLAARLIIVPAALAVGASAHSAPDTGPGNPLSFFAGRTEMVSTVKVVMRKPYRSRTVGDGRIGPDGTLTLVQQVHADGKPVEKRHWKMRRMAPGRFSGTMTDAIGPVTVEEVGDRYRFRFHMKGNLSVEQWVDPLPGGSVAKSSTTVRKLGVRVASSDGTIRKL